MRENLPNYSWCNLMTPLSYFFCNRCTRKASRGRILKNNFQNTLDCLRGNCRSTRSWCIEYMRDLQRHILVLYLSTLPSHSCESIKSCFGYSCSFSDLSQRLLVLKHINSLDSGTSRVLFGPKSSKYKSS
jgi:hypothetical protein